MISQDGLNPSLWKAMTCLSFIFDTMASDALAIQGHRASAEYSDISTWSIQTGQPIGQFAWTSSKIKLHLPKSSIRQQCTLIPVRPLNPSSIHTDLRVLHQTIWCVCWWVSEDAFIISTKSWHFCLQHRTRTITEVTVKYGPGGS